MTIAVLPADVIARIAAGEVIQRPASAVKELIENALDAGATSVRVEVLGGGLRLIRVVDDGAGIPADEIELALARHATSKLRQIDDLLSLQTLGFRGEALASIAAVGQVTLTSRPASQAAAVTVEAQAGVCVSRRLQPAPPGTTVTVRDLFANVPARLKFLRSPTAEGLAIQRVVESFALARPGVRWTLLLDGRTVLQSPGTGDLRDAVASVYGVEIARAMVPVDDAISPASSVLNLTVRGLVGLPTLQRSSRSDLTLTVNGRVVQSRMLAHAVREAYGTRLPADRYPIAVLDIVVPPAEVDVNVHPAKLEVRFRRDREVYAAVYRAVEAALAVPAAIPIVEPVSPSAPAASTQFALPFAEPVRPGDPARSTVADPAQGVVRATAAARIPILRVLGQVGATFIVAEGPDGIYLVDQHVAHERVIYERLRLARDRQAVEMQGLLEPLVVELAPEAAATLAEERAALTRMGFDVELFGQRAALVRGVPAVMKATDLAATVAAVIEDLAHNRQTTDWEDHLLATIACHSAIRAGQILTLEEMRELIVQLEAAQLPFNCPHGRPVLVHVSLGQLEREFGRR